MLLSSLWHLQSHLVVMSEQHGFQRKVRLTREMKMESSPVGDIHSAEVTLCIICNVLILRFTPTRTAKLLTKEEPTGSTTSVLVSRKVAKDNAVVILVDH